MEESSEEALEEELEELEELDENGTKRLNLCREQQGGRISFGRFQYVGLMTARKGRAEGAL